jgi:non-ribosomal peptide synthase protein (TIGR01720 family)
MNDLGARLANLSPEKRQLLMQLLQENRAQAPTVLPAAPAGEAALPVSDANEVIRVPLMPLQRWYFEEPIAADINHWNSVALLEVWPPLDPLRLEQALRHVIIHHDALRVRFVQEATSWQQLIVPFDGTVPFLVTDLAMVPQEEQGAAITAFVAHLHTSLNLSHGPLMRVALFTLGAERPGRFLFIIHHLITDVVSWRIILDDLQLAYQQLSQGVAVQLPPNTTSFKQWAERLTEHAQSTALMQEVPYWLSLPWDEIAPLSVDFPEGINVEERFSTIELALDAEVSRPLLRKIAQSDSYQLLDLLLTALVNTIAQWTGNRVVLVETLGHGREETLFDDVDLSRTVGWLASHTPLVLTLGAAHSLTEELQHIRMQLGQLKHHGIGFGLLRYLSADPALREHLQRLPQPKIFFNYLGQIRYQPVSDTALFRPAQESTEPLTSPKNVRLHLLTWVVKVLDDQICVTLEYCENVYRRSTIEGLLHSFMGSLRAYADAIDDGIGQ